MPAQYDQYSKYVSALRTAAFQRLRCDRRWARAEGQYIFDDEGHRYLDLVAGFAVFSLGRNNPAIKQALKDVIDSDSANLVQLDCPPLAGQLAEALIRLAPPSVHRAFFCQSGTEANEAAIKFARKATGRTRFLFCAGAFHGLTTGSLSLNGDDPGFRDKYGELLPSTSIPLNDAAALERELRAGDVAGFIVEPIQGKNMQVATDEFLRRAGELCKQHGAVFVVDEVQTGIGRTGKMFASEYAGITPDIITVSKALSGGFIPIGVCLHAQAIHDRVFPPLFAHSSTFKENDLAMTVGLAVLRELEQGRYLERVNRLSAYFVATLNSLRSKHDRLGEIRGRGLMLSIDVHGDAGTVIEHVTTALLRDERVLVQVGGWIKLTPSFVLTEADIDSFGVALDRVMTRWKS